MCAPTLSDYNRCPLALISRVKNTEESAIMDYKFKCLPSTLRYTALNLYSTNRSPTSELVATNKIFV